MKRGCDPGALHPWLDGNAGSGVLSSLFLGLVGSDRRSLRVHLGVTV